MDKDKRSEQDPKQTSKRKRLADSKASRSIHIMGGSFSQSLAPWKSTFDHLCAP